MKMKFEDTAYASRILPGVLLEGTSQGGAFDRPPQHWIRDELMRFGVQKATDIKRSDLEDCIHPLFQPRTWPELTADSERYKALRPCLLLATKLLKVAAPFFASIVPKPKYYNEHSRRIHVNENPTQEELRNVLLSLTEMAPYVEWREDPLMWPTLGRQGITMPSGGGIKPDEPTKDDEDAEYWEWATRRDKNEGLPYRRITFYIASQYLDVLTRLDLMDPPNEQYLQTVFMCAVTIVHEVGHLAFAANLSNRPWLGEPYVKGEALAELGTSLTGFLFDGWIPESITLRQDGLDDLTMSQGCCWFKQRRSPRAYPRYNTIHSMPLRHIQRILRQEEWDKLDDSDIATFSTNVRKNLLRPQTPFRSGETARIARKRECYRYDYSPSLRGGTPTAWDFHDPDWSDVQPVNRGTSSGVLVKKESASSQKNIEPDLDQENQPKDCDTGNITPSIDLWDIPSAVSTTPPANGGYDVHGRKAVLPKPLSGVKERLENVVPFVPGTPVSEPKSATRSSGQSCHTSNSEVPTVLITPCMQRKTKGVKADCASSNAPRRRSKRIRGEEPEMPDGLPWTPRKRARLS